MDADVNNFIPGGTYLQDWYNVQVAAFNTLGADVDVYIRGIDHSDPRNWPLLEELAGSFDGSEYIAETNIWFTTLRGSEYADGLS